MLRCGPIVFPCWRLWPGMVGRRQGWWCGPSWALALMWGGSDRDGIGVVSCVLGLGALGISGLEGEGVMYDPEVYARFPADEQLFGGIGDIDNLSGGHAVP